MGFFQKFLAQLPLLPGIVQGIEGLITETGQGATKKQLAMDSLDLATGIAGQVLPGAQLEIQAGHALVSGAIDLIVAGFNKTGWLGHSVLPVVPAPAVATNKTRRIG